MTNMSSNASQFRKLSPFLALDLGTTCPVNKQPHFEAFVLPEQHFLQNLDSLPHAHADISELLHELLPHQLANQTQAPPRADSSFCSSAYGVLAAVSSCCSPPKGRVLRITHPSATGNTTSRPTCMC
ncbi:lateral organ boundaries (LOB) domain family protein [Striga asiatica]|uniref:Lateral organ boundaries (LOB) domain family protein n=1 Tax=Striga asiatica TaxID=4170 RepID=A0A5A7PB95_STRAF|nr:lateral organ boundaries (LOB) domain family protein [Striga asiatica]